MLLHEYIMSHRTVEKKDRRRVSSTALGKRKSTGDGATSRPTPARTPGRVSIAGVNEVPPSTGTVQELQPTSSRHQVLQRTLVLIVLQRRALLWARQVSKISTMVRLVNKKHQPNSSALHRKIRQQLAETLYC